MTYQEDFSTLYENPSHDRTRELEKSLQRLSAIINNSVAGIISFDRQGTIKTINHAARDIFNIPVDSTPRKIHAYIPQICFPANEAARKLCTGIPLEDTLGERTEGSALCEQGNQVMIEYSISRIEIDGDDEFTAIISDISERKIAEADLIEARYIAEEASRAKSEFLSNMSHELRTPLNAILGFSQLLQMHDLGENNNANVKEILQAGRHLLSLINQVLDLSRIESGRVDYYPQEVKLIQLIMEAVSLVKNIVDEKQIIIDYALDDCSELMIKTDPTRFKQIMLNLLSNAVKYNKHQGRISLKVEQLENKNISIQIEDTGRGIAQGHLDRIFQPFDRLDSSTYVVEGTGIGLTICRHLVQIMGGTIHVESEPGKGSCFTVTLPG
ncbi:MAG: PAS domain-containing sensor histidine kinase [Gammaproteobacteria bacterium]|nr:PAS domain-containing sensor histidine kinase [Gammaproteobacteria bacterium]